MSGRLTPSGSGVTPPRASQRPARRTARRISRWPQVSALIPEPSPSNGTVTRVGGMFEDAFDSGNAASCRDAD
jgi:hypothetical protein